MAGVTAVRPFQIRGRFFTAIALRVAARPDAGFMAALDAQLGQTPQFFADAPVVIDLQHAAGVLEPGDLGRLVDELRSRKLSVFGVQNGTADQTEAATTAGLIELTGGRDVQMRTAGRNEARPEPEAAPTAPPAASPKEAPAPANRLVVTPVRSGQTVFADRGDLIVVAPVGSGAELIAAGNIHVYGQLRGRALAGVNGDETARIFCQSLDADLLAIAGIYRTSETLGPEVRGRSVQVHLQGDRLCIEAMGQQQIRDRSSQ